MTINAITAELLAPALPLRTYERWGSVKRAIGTSVRVSGLEASIGQRCEIFGEAQKTIQADVVGVESDELILYPLGMIEGIGVGSKVRITEHGHEIPFSEKMVGGIFDGFGHPMGNTPEVKAELTLALSADSPDPLKRKKINQIFTTGIRAIDGLLTTGVGQRMGVFATAGGGKSTLLAMLARASEADVIVIGLVGERGREVVDFIELLDESGARDRTVLVVAASDRPAMERAHSAKTTTAIAEGFRQRGKRVLMLMDSVTRYARALREIGLSAGEPPVRRGFPPSVFAELPRLFERTGNDENGSITAFYTILVEGEDEPDPIAEECRSILDGHIVLSRALGEAGHYPAIDILQSTSRLFTSLAANKDQEAAVQVRRLLAKHKELEFILQLGEYQAGSDTLADEAIAKQEAIRQFLVQPFFESAELNETTSDLCSLHSKGQG